MMGRDKTMASKMSVVSETESGKPFHTNYDWMRACFCNFHDMATADIINLCWSAFLRRLVTLQEVAASSYLYQQYTSREPVAQIISWDCLVHATCPSEMFMFLTWWVILFQVPVVAKGLQKAYTVSGRKNYNSGPTLQT